MKKIMTGLLVAAISLSTLSSCGYSSRDLERAFSDGRDEGWESGYSVGHEDGATDALHEALLISETKDLDFEGAIWTVDSYLHDIYPDKEDISEDDFMEAVEFLFDLSDYFFENHYI